MSGLGTRPRVPTDDELVESLRNPHTRNGFLEGIITSLRTDMAWAASNLPPPSRERQLLEKGIQQADHTLALIKKADKRARSAAPAREDDPNAALVTGRQP